MGVADIPFPDDEIIGMGLDALSASMDRQGPRTFLEDRFGEMSDESFDKFLSALNRLKAEYT
jgi:hypothetical protein